MGKAGGYLQFPLLDRAKLDLTLKLAAMALLTMALFYRDFYYTFENAFQNVDAILTLFGFSVFAYLVYRKRKMLAAVTNIENRDQPKRIKYLVTLTGLVVPVAALLFYWHGSLTSMPLWYHFLSLPIFIAGLVLLLFNYEVLRQLLFPIAFLFFLSPVPIGFLQEVGQALSGQFLGLSVSITRLIGVPSTLSTAGQPMIMIQRSGGTFEQVGVAFSPLYYLLIFIVFAGLAAYLTKGTILSKTSTVLQVIPLTYFLNLMRVTAVVSLDYYVAGGSISWFFNLLGGLIFVCVLAVWLSFVSRKNSGTRPFEKGNDSFGRISRIWSNLDFSFILGRVQLFKKKKSPSVDFLKLAAVAIFIIALASIQSPIFAFTPSPSISLTDTLTGQQTLSDILPDIPNYSLQVFQGGGGAENFACLYAPDDPSLELIRVSVQLSSDRSSLPPWNETMIRAERELIRQGRKPDTEILEASDLEIYQKPSTPSSFLAWWDVKTAQTEAVLYWYGSAVFKINSTVQSKYVLVSIGVTPNSGHTLSFVKSQLASFAGQIISYWLPILPWSAATGIVTSFGGYVAGGMLCGIFGATLILCSGESRSQKRASRITYLKLSKQDQQFVERIPGYERQVTPTLDRVMGYQVKREQFEGDKFIQKLIQLERIGVLKSSIVNDDDEPKYIWKTIFSNILDQYQ